MTAADPLVDLDTLPPELVEPIQTWVDQYRNTPRFERGIKLFGVQLTIHSSPRGPLIRASELKSVFTRSAELAEASQRVLRQQAAELAAENDLALVKGRNESLKERLLAATRVEAELTAEKTALLAHADDLLRKNKQLSEELECAEARRARELVATATKLLVENAALQNEIDRLKTERNAWQEERAALAHQLDHLREQNRRSGTKTAFLRGRLKQAEDRAAELAASSAKVCADNDALRARVKQLDAEHDRLKEMNWSETSAASRFRAENKALKAALAAEVARLSSLKDEGCEWQMRARDYAARIRELRAEIDRKLLEHLLLWKEPHLRRKIRRAMRPEKYQRRPR